MTQAISSFIREYYDVAYKSPDLKNAADAKVFLLGTICDNISIAKIHALFVNQMSCPQDAVLIDSAPAMERVMPQQYLSSMYLNPQADTMVGWDVKELKPYSEVKDGVVKTAWEATERYLSETDTGQKEALYSDLLQSQKKSAPLLAKMVRDLYDTHAYSKGTLLDKRLQSLISTIEKIQQLSTGRLFAVVPQPFVHHDFAPAIMRNYLASSKATAVLFPKDAVVKEMGKGERELAHRLLKDLFEVTSDALRNGFFALGQVPPVNEKLCKTMFATVMAHLQDVKDGKRKGGPLNSLSQQSMQEFQNETIDPMTAHFAQALNLDLDSSHN